MVTRRSSRSDPDFLFKTIEIAINYGARTINIPDTVGYSIPEEFGNLIKKSKVMLLILIKQLFLYIVTMILV